jgi:hypothetical protein
MTEVSGEIAHPGALVPVIHQVTFCCEVEVEAREEEQTAEIAVKDDCEIGADYDWDRMDFPHAELGHWRQIERIGR